MMNKLKLLLSSLLATCLFFVASSILAGSAYAATFSLSPASKIVNIGDDVTITVGVDTSGTAIFGGQATIGYPANGFTVKNVSYGSFFPDTITPIQSSGQIILQGDFLNSTTGTGSGNGTFATITFTATKASGTGTVNFSCNGAYNDSFILNASGVNILACSSLNQSVITFSTGSTPTPTPPPGGTTPPTNACGGTCGSVYNCNTGLFCYQGYCRNPDCPSSSTCGACSTATPTAKPTVRPTYKPTPKSSATPIVVALATATPAPSFTPFATPATPVPGTGSATPAVKPVFVWIGLGVLALVVIMILINALRRKSPPKFTPPTNVPPTFPTTPPMVNPPQTF